MTVASEITRLQWAKSDIRQAIIDKWVDVWANLTLDEYAACIAEISTWPKTWYVDVLVVWWGWWGGCGWSYWWWWGGGWQVMEFYWFPITDICLNVEVGWWWTMRNSWGNSCIGEIIACWGWSTRAEWWATSGSWCPWWAFVKVSVGNTWWWWGGAWWAWCASNSGSTWGKWVCSDISWSSQAYWWWGGGWFQSSSPWASWCDGGGDWWGRYCIWCNATGYWGWWWWGWYYCSWGTWWQWIVIVRYKTDWSCWICNTSTWWTKYTCWDYTIHCFTNTSNVEEFIPVYN